MQKHPKMIAPLMAKTVVDQARRELATPEEGKPARPIVSLQEIGEYVAQKELYAEEQKALRDFNKSLPGEEFVPVALFTDHDIDAGLGVLKAEIAEEKHTQTVIPIVPQLSVNGVEFFTQCGKTYYKKKNSELTLLADALLSIQSAIVELDEIYNEAGSVIRYDRNIFYQVSLDMGTKKQELKVARRRLLQNSRWVITDEVDCVVTVAEKMLPTYMGALINQGGFPVSYVFSKPGWKWLDVETFKGISTSRWGYVTAEGVVGMPELPIRCIEKYNLHIHNMQIPPNHRNAFHDIWNYATMFKNPAKGLFLVTYTFLSTLTSLFNVAGVPVKFLVALLGETGSRKTSAALALCKIFGREQIRTADISFRSTLAALNKATASCTDSIIIFDDILPQDSAEATREQNQKIEQVIREYGDRVPRRRCGDYAKTSEGAKEFFAVLGCALLTGEDFRATASSKLRVIQLHIAKEDIDNAILTDCQNNPTVVSCAIEDFLLWVTEHQEEVLSSLQAIFEEHRREFTGKFQHARSVDVASIMFAFTQIYSDFIRDRGYLQGAELQDWIVKELNTILSVVQANERHNEQDSPVAFVFKALNDAINKKDVSFSDVENGASEKCILVDSDYIYVKLEVLYSICSHFGKNYSIFTPFPTKEALRKCLAEKELIVSRSEGNRHRYTHKLPKSASNDRYLFFPRKRFLENLKKYDEEVKYE